MQINDPRSQHPTTEPHGQAVAGSNPALGYLVSLFKRRIKLVIWKRRVPCGTIVLCAILKYI